MRRRHAGPGIVKAGSLPIAQRRTVELWSSSDYRVRELFERADVMSEGAIRHEASGASYYGTTSILLPTASRGGFIPDSDCGSVTELLRANPHARLRAIRIACREAQVRTHSPIGLLHAEVVVHGDAEGVRFDIDVAAALIDATQKAKSRARR